MDLLGWIFFARFTEIFYSFFGLLILLGQWIFFLPFEDSLGS